MIKLYANAFLEYWTQVDNGKIIACNKIKKLAKKLLYNYYNPRKWHYDDTYARKHIDFIEHFCTLDNGKGKAIPIQLTVEQKAWLSTIYGFIDDDGIRQYNEVFLMMGRKNGKTELISCLEIDLAVNDAEPTPQIVNCATNKEQANLGFTKAYNMIQRSKALSKAFRKKAGSHLFIPMNFGTIKALASNVNSLDGLDCHGAVLDEMGAYKSRGVYDLIRQSTGARKQPLIITITTNGFIRHNIFDAQYDYASKIIDSISDNERFLPLLYELDSEDEWDKEECWIKANPLLGKVKGYDYLREQVQKAKDDPSYYPTVLVKEFNLPQTGESSYLTYEELFNDEVITIEQLVKEGCKYYTFGFDAAESTDLNAFCVLMKRPKDNKYYAFPMFWIPEEVILNQQRTGNKERDNVPYELWIKQGYMRTFEGTKVNKRVFLDYIKELRQNYGIMPQFGGYDPWHVDDTLKQDTINYVGKGRFNEVRQGTRTLSQPMKDLKEEFRANNIVYNNNPVMQWCLYNCNIKTDINGNIQPIKSSDRTQRIDGVIALLCAYIVMENNINNYLNLNKSKPQES